MLRFSVKNLNSFSTKKTASELWRMKALQGCKLLLPSLNHFQRYPTYKVYWWCGNDEQVPFSLSLTDRVVHNWYQCFPLFYWTERQQQIIAAAFSYFRLDIVCTRAIVDSTIGSYGLNGFDNWYICTRAIVDSTIGSYGLNGFDNWYICTRAIVDSTIGSYGLNGFDNWYICTRAIVDSTIGSYGLNGFDNWYICTRAIVDSTIGSYGPNGFHNWYICTRAIVV